MKKEALIISISLIAILFLFGCTGNSPQNAINNTGTTTQPQNHCGDSLCQSDETAISCPSDCPTIQNETKHKECLNQKCVEVDGEGQDQCAIDADCIIPTHSECKNEQCIEVQGAGINQCQKDNDCITCENECAQQGLKQCSGNGYKTCDNYDSDSCLEWGAVIACPTEASCQNGECKEIILSNQFKDKMIWDLPALARFTFREGVDGPDQLRPYQCLDLRYISPEDNDQHSEFLLCIFNSSEEADNYFSAIPELPGTQKVFKEINGNKVLEKQFSGGEREISWTSGNKAIRGWNGNDIGTVQDNTLFDTLTEGYLENYLSTMP